MRICLHCGMPEDHHHVFRPVKLPAGCVCDAYGWGNPRAIPPVCITGYVEDEPPYRGHCKTCEHLEACHRLEKGTP